MNQKQFEQLTGFTECFLIGFSIVLLIGNIRLMKRIEANITRNDKLREEFRQAIKETKPDENV